MVRCTSYIGLNNKARNYIKRRMARGTLQDVTERISNRPDKIKGFCTYYRDPFSYSYDFPLDHPENKSSVFKFSVFHDLIRNRLIYEVEEASPWASGPNIMTFLVDEFGNQIKCSSRARFEEGEYRIYDDSGKWATSGRSEHYVNARYLGKTKNKKKIE